MTPELLALQDSCKRLEAAGVAYMLTGSLAMAYYARPRMTRDIDLVVALEADAASRLPSILGAEYHADPDAIGEAFRLRRPCNVIHLPTVVKIDFIPRKEGEYRETEFARRQRVYFAGVDLWIASREDLILSKLDWARDTRSELQLRDVRHLLEAPVDRAYLTLGRPASAWRRCSRRRPGDDTAPSIDRFVRERYAAMTGSERALMALTMFETAQRIVLSSLPSGLSQLERRRELCRRFYGDQLAREAY